MNLLKILMEWEAVGRDGEKTHPRSAADGNVYAHNRINRKSKRYFVFICYNLRVSVAPSIKSLRIRFLFVSF